MKKRLLLRAEGGAGRQRGLAGRQAELQGERRPDSIAEGRSSLRGAPWATSPHRPGPLRAGRPPWTPPRDPKDASVAPLSQTDTRPTSPRHILEELASAQNQGPWETEADQGDAPAQGRVRVSPDGGEHAPRMRLHPVRQRGRCSAGALRAVGVHVWGPQPLLGVFLALTLLQV